HPPSTTTTQSTALIYALAPHYALPISDHSPADYNPESRPPTPTARYHSRTHAHRRPRTDHQDHPPSTPTPEPRTQPSDHGSRSQIDRAQCSYAVTNNE